MTDKDREQAGRADDAATREGREALTFGETVPVYNDEYRRNPYRDMFDDPDDDGFYEYYG